MLKYFLSELEVRAKFISPRIANDSTKQELLGTAVNELNTFYERHSDSRANVNAEAWGHAYYLERIIALTEPPETLLGEVRRRLADAVTEGVPSAPRLSAAFDAEASQIIDTSNDPPTLKPNGEVRLRSMLLDILEETHWTIQRRYYAQPIQASATGRLVFAGLAACLLFTLPYAAVYFNLWRDPTYVLPFNNWTWLPLWTAATAGFFGAMFSRLLFLQMNWNNLTLSELKDARAFTSIVLRGAVGMTGAVVVYYFLLSGVIGGGLFPDFQHFGFNQLHFKESDGGQDTDAVPLRLILPNTQVALLVVWSFLAGLSERLVPGILQTTEASIGESAKQQRGATTVGGGG